MRRPRPAHPARSRAQRWGLRVALVVLALTSALGCQAALSSSPREAHAPATAVSMCQGGVGHEAVCLGAADAVAVSPTRAERADALALLVIVTVATVHAAAGASFRSRAGTGPPPWAAQRLVPGRQRLVAVGISRI